MEQIGRGRLWEEASKVLEPLHQSVKFAGVRCGPRLRQRWTELKHKGLMGVTQGASVVEERPNRKWQSGNSRLKTVIQGVVVDGKVQSGGKQAVPCRKTKQCDKLRCRKQSIKRSSVMTGRRGEWWRQDLVPDPDTKAWSLFGLETGPR